MKADPTETDLIGSNWSSPLAHLCILASVAILCGGGGVAYGLANLAVQLVALGILAIHHEEAIACWRQRPRWLVVLVVLSVALPLLHLTPMPNAAWQTLPGRELAIEARRLVDSEGWYPLTLDPGRTLVAATGLIVPFVVLTLALQLSPKDLARLGWVVVWLGMINFLLGVPQVLTNGDFGLLYPENPMPGVLFGTFANRNSTGLFLVASIVLALTLPIRASGAMRLRWAIVAALVVGVFLTRSRSAVVLLAIPAGLFAFNLWTTRSREPSDAETKRSSLLAAFGLLAAIATGWALAPHTRLAQTFERFSGGKDARETLWVDGIYSAQQFWPAGSGMGTFDEVFQVHESLENISLRSAGRAHNDFLEIAIEAGAPGLVLIACWLFAIGWLTIRARHVEDRLIAWAGSGVLVAIALQSAIDYPLRNQAMLCLAAFAFALLFSPFRERVKQP